MMSLRGWKNDFEALRLNPEPIHRRLLTGKPDAGNPPVRFGREGERQRSSYPHQGDLNPILAVHGFLCMLRL